MANTLKIFFSFLLLIVTACTSQPDAGKIINKAIEAHGGAAYDSSRIAFNFRNVHYSVKQKGGHFTYTRTFPDSLGGIADSLTNEGFNRTIARQPVALTAEEDSMYSNSVNSVIYFARLPYKLNDAAVNKSYLGETSINGEPYHKIEVTFNQKDGGNDYQDRYIYWIHRQNYTMDYLAYRFHVDGGGTRFREAQNVRVINGIRFANYNNFGGPDMEHPLEEYDTYFEADTLSKVSEIALEDIRVTRLGKDE